MNNTATTYGQLAKNDQVYTFDLASGRNIAGTVTNVLTIGDDKVVIGAKFPGKPAGTFGTFYANEAIKTY